MNTADTAIYEAALEARLAEIVADKVARKLKNTKVGPRQLSDAEAYARGMVVKAKFDARVEAQDPTDWLTDDPVWNPKHELHFAVNQGLDKGLSAPEAIAQAIAKKNAGEDVHDDTLDLVEWLEKQDWSEFALDVAKYYRTHGRLSVKQIAAARSMKAKVEARQAAKAEAVKTAKGLDLSSLPAGMYGVPGNDTRLKVKIEHGKPGTRWDGWTFVKDGAEYGNQKRYGIQRPDQTYQGQIEAALETILADPKAAMAEYGKLTGRCGNCGRKLEDAASVAAGIGPICARNVGW